MSHKSLKYINPNPNTKSYTIILTIILVTTRSVITPSDIGAAV